MIEVLSDLFSVLVMVFAFREQLQPFHASVVPPPSPETPATLTSLAPPSHLQTGIGLAMTIQLPPGTNGESHCGIAFPARRAGHPKQIAVPIPRVRVGVT